MSGDVAWAARDRSLLMDPGDLPRRERGARRVDEGFWRAGKGDVSRPSAAAARKKRRSTLPLQPVHKRRRPVGVAAR